MIGFGVAKVIALAAISGQDPPQVTVEAISKELVIEWRRKKVDLDTRVMTFEDGATAYYGPTVVVADRIVIDAQNETGTATGNVQVRDPIGTLTCSDLYFDYRNRSGRARGVDVVVDGARLRIKSVDINPIRWEVSEVRAGLFGNIAPHWEIGSPKVTLTPGASGTIQRPALYVDNVPKIVLPSTKFSLDRRATGLRPPSVSLRDGKIGVTTFNSLLITAQSAVSFYNRFAKGQLPSTSLEYTWSSVPAGRAESLIAPRSDLDERFVDSYVDNITVPSRQVELDQLRAPRQSIGIGTAWTVGTSGRPVDSSDISKLYEATVEVGDDLGFAGGYAQGRIQRIRPDRHTSFLTRGNFLGTLTSDPFPIGKNLTGLLRLDGGVYLAGSTKFGWARGLGAVDWRPHPNLSLSAGYAGTGSSGTMQFAFDGVRTGHAFLSRLDMRSGPYAAGVILKFDPRTRKIFDHQYQFSFFAGAFEPFLVLRQNPKTVTFGVRLRLDSLIRRLQNRDFVRGR
ncbi:MAG: LPS-assembly protein LptD [Fimbriimonadaceae bacterium]|nr:LPS-assembly protein LptD [Fimbriimonadaceae bacterium]